MSAFHSALEKSNYMDVLVLMHLNDSYRSLSLSATDSTWFSSLGECLLQSGVMSDVFRPETFKSGVSEYKKMDASTRLKLLNFLCDESLCTLYVFTFTFLVIYASL